MESHLTRSEKEKLNHQNKISTFAHILEKTCTRCKITKLKEEFLLNRGTKDGYLNQCKDCKYIQRQEERTKHPEKVKAREKKNYENNKHKKISYRSNYRKANLELFRLYNKEYRKRKKGDILHDLKTVIRARLSCLINKKKVGKNTLDLIGCSYEDLKIHLEKQFTEGMNWENRGKFGWHIDHIIPLYSAKDQESLIKLAHYTNLQPLWAEENLKKGHKLLWQKQKELETVKID